MGLPSPVPALPFTNESLATSEYAKAFAAPCDDMKKTLADMVCGIVLSCDRFLLVEKPDEYIFLMPSDSIDGPEDMLVFSSME